MKNVGYRALWRQPKDALHSLQGQSYHSSKQRITEVARVACSLMRSGAIERLKNIQLKFWSILLPPSGFRGLGLFFRVAPNSAFLPQQKHPHPYDIPQMMMKWQTHQQDTRELRQI